MDRRSALDDTGRAGWRSETLTVAAVSGAWHRTRLLWIAGAR